MVVVIHVEIVSTIRQLHMDYIYGKFGRSHLDYQVCSFYNSFDIVDLFHLSMSNDECQINNQQTRT